MRDYLRRLRGGLISEGTPYGFTLVIWGAGMAADDVYGHLTVAGIFLFITPPVLIYGILVLILERGFPEASSPPRLAQESSGFSYVDLLSVLPTVACAYGIYLVLPDQYAGLPAASASAMLVYNLLLALQHTLTARYSHGHDQ